MKDSYPNLNRERLTEEETRELIARAQQGCIASRNKVVEHNLLLVISTVNRMTNADTVEKEDLTAEGNFGLFEAVARFNPNYIGPNGQPIRFSTYAVWWISNFVRMAKRRPPYTGVMALPEAVLSMLKKPDEIQEALASPEMKVHLISARMSMAPRVHISRRDRDDKDMAEAIPFREEQKRHDDDMPAPNEVVERLKQSELLNRREKLIVQLNIMKGITLKKLARHLDISTERCRQIRNRALSKLRNELMEEVTC